MTTELVVTERDYGVLSTHLFPGDRDEHAVIVLCGVRRDPDGVALLVREVHPLFEDEFIPGEKGYRQIAPRALARLGNRAHDQGLALATFHSHPGATTHNALSGDDLSAHRRVFPHLLDIVGAPVAGVALGTHSAAGEVWLTGEQPRAVDAVRVVGHRLRRLAPHPAADTDCDDRFDRQVRLFGNTGQQILRDLHVGVVGLGGGGSLLVEQIAHLGVKAITGVDFDRVESHNLSRIVGATEDDARRGTKKVEVARRLSHAIDPSIRFTAIDGDIAEAAVARALGGCDFLFLATDSITSRLVLNAIAHTYLVPMVQIGAKVDVLPSGEIGMVYVAVRPVLPDSGCLQCAGVINPDALRDEANSEEERAAQNYLGRPDIVDPSVITLNAVAASAASQTMLMWAVGLAEPELLKHRIYDGQTGVWLTLESQRDQACSWCCREERSRFARGDSAVLPVRRRSDSATHRSSTTAGGTALIRRLISRLGSSS